MLRVSGLLSRDFYVRIFDRLVIKDGGFWEVKLFEYKHWRVSLVRKDFIALSKLPLQLYLIP